MPIDVLQGQTTMHDNGKPIYYFCADYTGIESVAYKLYPVKNYQEWLHCKNYCEKLTGNHATIYLKPTSVSRAVVLSVITKALTDIGIMKGQTNE